MITHDDLLKNLGFEKILRNDENWWVRSENPSLTLFEKTNEDGSVEWWTQSTPGFSSPIQVIEEWAKKVNSSAMKHQELNRVSQEFLRKVRESL